MLRALAVVLALALPVAAAAEVVVVEMTTVDFEPRFVPEEVTVRPGDTVRWVNTDPTALEHVTCSGTGSFDPAAGDLWLSPTLAFGQWYEHTFEDVGTFDYFSVPHEFAGMFGVVVVTTSTGGGDNIETSTWGLIKRTASPWLPRD
jgi:plastocyanin